MSIGIAIVLLLAIAVLAVPAVRHLRESPPAPPPPVQLSLGALADAELGSGDQLLDAAISPDERQIVFVATANGMAALWRRELDSERAERIAGTDGAQLPAWKGTANVIAFFAGDRLKQVSLTGGEVRDLTTAVAARGASWLPDGSVLFAADSDSAIRRLQNGIVSNATMLKPDDRSHAFPIAVGASVPDSFVYTATLNTGRRVVRLVDSDGERDLTTTTGHGQLVADMLLFVRDGALLGQQFDRETRQLMGRAVPLVLAVGTDSTGRGHFAASPRVLVAAPGGSRLHQLTWFSGDTGKGLLTREPGNYWQVRLSPDDRSAALTQTTPLLRTLDIVLVPMSDTGYVEPLTRAVAADSDPVWSPDGRRILFRSFQDGPPRLYMHATDDQDAADEPVPAPGADDTPTDWYGGRAVVQAPGRTGDTDIWSVVPSTGAREAVASSRFNETDGRVSADGRWIAYVSDESGQADIYAAPWPRGARVRVSFAGGTRPRWGRDGRTLYFLRGNQMMRTELASGSSFTTARPVFDVPGIRDFDVAHRRDAVLALVPAATSTGGTASVIVDWRSLGN